MSDCRSTKLLRTIMERIADQRLISDILPKVETHLAILDAQAAVVTAVLEVLAAKTKETTLIALARVKTTAARTRDLMIEDRESDPSQILRYQALIVLASEVTKTVNVVPDDIAADAATAEVAKSFGNRAEPSFTDVDAAADRFGPSGIRPSGLRREPKHA